MTNGLREFVMRLGCGVYGVLLWMYPRAFRRKYGSEMKQVFRTHLRDILSGTSVQGLGGFCLHTSMDLVVSVVKEQAALMSVMGVVCLIGAMGVGLYGAYVDHHNASEVYPTLAVVLAGSFVLGLVRPRKPWRWALIVGACVAFAGPVAEIPQRLTSGGTWAIMAILTVPGLIGVYMGAFLHLAIRMTVRRERMG